METALYFPHMSIPTGAWFRQILLYWDRAAMIMPSTAQERERALDPYMGSLFKEELLSFIDPTETLFADPRGHDAFLNNFLGEVVGNTTHLGKSRSKFTPVHIRKMEWSLFDELRRRGLATVGPNPEDQEWWQVEPKTANLYLAYLASALSAWRRAQVNEDNMFPVADRGQPLEWLAQPITAGEKLREIRYRVITSALPVPEGNVDAVELRTFKDDHHEKLERLRRHLDTTLDELVDIDDKQRRGDRVDRFRGEISDDLALLREDMERRRWPRVVLYGFGGIVATGLAAGATAMSGGTALAMAMWAGSAIAASSPAVVIEAKEALQTPRDYGRAPLAYAALAAQRFGG